MSNEITKAAKEACEQKPKRQQLLSKNLPKNSPAKSDWSARYHMMLQFYPMGLGRSQEEKAKMATSENMQTNMEILKKCRGSYLSYLSDPSQKIPRTSQHR